MASGLQLGLTIPLQRFLHLPKPPYGGEAGLRLCWDLHLLRPSGTPALLAVHASSRYAFLLLGPSPAEWQDIPALFLHGLRQAFAAEGYTAQQLGQYLALAGPPVLTKTHGRRPVAFLNRVVDDFYTLPAGLRQDALFQPETGRFLNDLPCRAAGHEGPGTARQFLRRDMEGLI